MQDLLYILGTSGIVTVWVVIRMKVGSRMVETHEQVTTENEYADIRNILQRAKHKWDGSRRN